MILHLSGLTSVNELAISTIVQKMAIVYFLLLNLSFSIGDVTSEPHYEPYCHTRDKCPTRDSHGRDMI